MKKIKLGIIGCGNIGSILAKNVEKEFAGKIEQVVLWDVDKDKMGSLAESVALSRTVLSMEGLFKEADIVVEAVSPSVVPEILECAIASGKDVMIMSIGGFAGREELLDKAGKSGVKVILPSGAIAGLDALKAAKVSGIESVTITTRKPPRSLAGSDYLVRNGIDIETIKEETVIFEGNARSAIKAFPKNINVSALLSIAGIGFDKTMVRITSSPEFDKNSHEVVIISSSGKITARTDNVPSPDNPKTSYLAPLSCIAALKGYLDTVRIGT